MKHKELMMRFAAVGMSATMLYFTPITTLATEQSVKLQVEQSVKENKLSTAAREKQERSGVADENGFVIENGTLIDYIGDAEIVVIPERVTMIGDSAFSGCETITKVTIPNSVTVIGLWAFSDCKNLIEIEIPNGITSIEYGTFKNCENLAEIKIPTSVTIIEQDAFKGTKWLENKRDENPLVVVNSILVDAQTATGIVEIPNNVTTIGADAFRNSGITELVIPEHVTSVQYHSFFNCQSLTKVTFPNSVTVIDDFLFSGCSNLEEVVLPNHITSIGQLAFDGCSNLKEITIPESVTSLGLSAFYGCESLTEVVIPNKVTNIGAYAFYGCTNLTKAVIPESVIEMWDETFQKTAENFTIYGYANSYAETYAKEHNIPFLVLEKEEVPPKKPFKDVTEGIYYYEPVLWAVDKNITTGWKDDEFAPELSCTRGQVVTFLWRAMGKPEPSTTENPFIDVLENEYYTKAVLWALEKGITTGYDSTHFAPEATVTRSQFVTFLHRTENKPSYSVENPFKDVEQGHYYDAILWAYENGITTGLNETTFGSEDSCTRGQVVTFLYRALKDKENVEDEDANNKNEGTNNGNVEDEDTNNETNEEICTNHNWEHYDAEYKTVTVVVKEAWDEPIEESVIVCFCGAIFNQDVLLKGRRAINLYITFAL